MTKRSNNGNLKKEETAINRDDESVKRRIASSDEKHYLAFDKMLEGVQINDFNWRYVYVNDAIVKRSKFLKEELIGFTLMEKFPGVEQTDLFKFLDRCMIERRTEHFETELILPDGHKGYFDLSIQPIPEGLFILSMDMTERKVAEEQLRQLNLELEARVEERTKELQLINQELESFSYSVSHDLRAPLRAINGYAKILQEDYIDDLDNNAVNCLQAIMVNSKKMGNLIDDLLTFSRLERKQILLSEVNMAALIETVKEELISNSLDKNTEFKLLPVMPAKAESSIIKQVWMNLISNAIKYSRLKSKPIIEIGSFEKDNQIVYYVRDNGVGFDMKYYDKLFGVFQRLHSEKDFEGTGIGLAIVKKIVFRHNGRVWAESKLNEGACFYFSLPI
jgi:signal transduction histidine kinase